MSRKFRFLAIPAVLLMMSACVSVSASRLGTGTVYPEVAKGQVLVYQSEADVPGDYEKVALLYVSGDANSISHRQMIEAARKKAGRLGANAIVLAEFEDPKFSTRVASVIFDVPVERRTQMLAIRTQGSLSAESAEARQQVQR
jgi:hypothetical protein